MTVVITTHVRFLLLFFCYAHSPAQHSFPTRRSSDLAMSKLFGGGQKAASKQFRHGATSKSRSNTASNSTKHKDRKSGSAGMPRPISYAVFCLKKKRGEGDANRWRLTPERRRVLASGLAKLRP